MARDIEQTIQPHQKSVFIHEGGERTYLYYLPASHSPEKKHPVVLVLHGSGANAENAFRMADMEPLADREDFILVYPDGSGKEGDRVFTWNSGHCCGYAFAHDVDDAGFLKALVDYFIREHSGDARRVYIAGFSNGAMMAYRMACDYSESVAAIAAVSGSMNYDKKKPDNPVSVVAFHGTRDDYAPYAGGANTKSRYSRLDNPVRDSMFFWAKHNGCVLTPEEKTEGSITRTYFGGGKAGSEVLLYTINDGGHAWPGGRDGARYGNVEPPTREINATELIWDFFKHHTRRAGQ